MQPQNERLDLFLEEGFSQIDQSLKIVIDRVTPEQILSEFDPYFLAAQDIHTAHDLVDQTFRSYLGRIEKESIEVLLKRLAADVCGRIYGCKTESAKGVDLEFVKEDIVYLICVKPDPGWGSTQQVSHMVANLKSAKRNLRIKNPELSVGVIIGCLYGRDEQFDKGEYWKLCGQRFWAFISGNDDLYIQIIESLVHRAKQRNDDFQKSYARAINRLEREVLTDFVSNDLVDWDRLIQFVSAASSPKKSVPKKRASRESATDYVVDSQSAFDMEILE